MGANVPWCSCNISKGSDSKKTADFSMTFQSWGSPRLLRLRRLSSQAVYLRVQHGHLGQKKENNELRHKRKKITISSSSQLYSGKSPYGYKGSDSKSPQGKQCFTARAKIAQTTITGKASTFLLYSEIVQRFFPGDSVHRPQSRVSL